MSNREKLVERLQEMASRTPPVCQYDRPKEVEILGKQITVYCKPFEQFQDLMREAADAIVNGVTVQRPINTNADRIRSMNDEELAYYLASLTTATRRGVAYSTDGDRWFSWLQQPTEGGNNDNL